KPRPNLIARKPTRFGFRDGTRRHPSVSARTNAMYLLQPCSTETYVPPRFPLPSLLVPFRNKLDYEKGSGDHRRKVVRNCSAQKWRHCRGHRLQRRDASAIVQDLWAKIGRIRTCEESRRRCKKRHRIRFQRLLSIRTVPTKVPRLESQTNYQYRNVL